MKKTQTQTTAQHLSLALSSLLFLSQSLFTRGYALEINSADAFIDFAKKVNSGSNYAGDTVYLTSNLDFSSYSSSFVPVGKSNDASIFRGTFDGRGHTISNLKVSTDEFPFLGVFGYSSGATIKNLVVDESCSFESGYLVYNVNCAVGGIIGWCYSSEGECIVEGCVNMASIEYAGTYVNCNLPWRNCW